MLKLLKYFYSWYTLPHVLLHEFCHIILAKLLGIKILKIKINKCSWISIYNGICIFEYKKYSWKWLCVVYAPLLQLIPFFLIFINPIFIYISLYLISTMIFYKKQFIWMVLPSKTDFQTKNKIKYFTYLEQKTSNDILNHYRKRNELNKLIRKYHLLTEKEFLKK